MEKLKSIIFLFILAVFTPQGAAAYDFMVGGLCYNYINGADGSKVGVTGQNSNYPSYSNLSGSISIPSSVSNNGKTYSVTSIGDHAFTGCTSLANITIPNSVTRIGDYAFERCTGLTSVSIPNSVTSIGYEAFRGCSGLISISVGIGNTKYDSRDNCNAIIVTASNTLIAGCKSSTIPSSVTSIGSSAFSGCSGLTNVTIPNWVTDIGSSAFSGCSGLTSITIGESVQNLPYGMFNGCINLTNIVVVPGNSVFDSRDNCNAIIETASNTLIAGCKSTTIPNSVRMIGDYYAFSGCTGLTSITIPNSIRIIGLGAFSGCSGLTSITIGNSVKSISWIAFARCTGLKSVICLATTPPVVQSTTFSEVPSNCKLSVPYGCSQAYKSADYWKDFTNIVELPPLGDVNADNVVDVQDFNIIVNTMLGISGNADADVNGDGEVDIFDINYVVNKMLNIK